MSQQIDLLDSGDALVTELIYAYGDIRLLK